MREVRELDTSESHVVLLLPLRRTLPTPPLPPSAMAMVAWTILPRPSSPLVSRSCLLVKIMGGKWKILCTSAGVSEFSTRVATATSGSGYVQISNTASLFQLTTNPRLSRCNFSGSAVPSKMPDKTFLDLLRNKKIVPEADPPSTKDVDLLCQFFSQSDKLTVLTGAGMSTESGIPDYRSPNGAYSYGFKPITHQQFVRSSRARKRYWARSYAGWRRFTAAHPSAGHSSLSTLEKAGRVHFIITQNVDRLHHRAGSDPLELHGSVYVVTCLECGASVDRELFQDQVKDLNPKWAAAIESLKYHIPGSDKSFGMQQRPDGDIEIDEKFWEADFDVPNCQRCNGLLKPDVVFFGDNVPKDRAAKAMEAAKDCDSFLVLGSSLMTMSAFRLVRAAHESGAAIAIINVGDTRADDLASLKINARCGEILPRVIEAGCLTIPNIYSE